MTIQTDSRTTSEMLTDGSNKVFHFGFPIFKGDNGQKGVEVLFVNDLGFDVVDPSLFAVIEDSDNSGGIVQFYEAPETGKRLVITGNTPVDQQLDITNYNRFHGASIETNFDKIIAIAQEFFSKLNEEIRQRINNNLEIRDYADKKLSELEDWATAQLPDIAKSQFDLMLNDFKVEWQNALNTITLKVGVPALAVIDESGENQQQVNNKGIKDYSASLAYAEGSLSIKDGMLQKYTSGVWRPKDPTYYDFGAKIDGVTDDTAAFIAYHTVFKKAQLPVGTMVLSSINLDQFMTGQKLGIAIEGVGTEVSVFAFTGVGNGFYSGGNRFFRDFRLSNLTLYNGGATRTKVGFYIGSGGAEQVVLKSVGYNNWKVGRATHCWNSSMEDEIFRYCGIPLAQYGTSTDISNPYANTCDSAYHFGYSCTPDGVVSVPALPYAYSQLSGFAADHVGAVGNSVYKFGNVSGLTLDSLGTEITLGTHVFDFSEMASTETGVIEINNFAMYVQTSGGFNPNLVGICVKPPTNTRSQVIFNNAMISTEKQIYFVSGDGSGIALNNPKMSTRAFTMLSQNSTSGMLVDNVAYGKDAVDMGEIGVALSSNSVMYSRLKNLRGKALLDPTTQKLVLFCGSLSEGLAQGLMMSAIITAQPLNKNGSNTNEKAGQILISSSMDYNASDMAGHLKTVRTGTLTTATTVTRNMTNTTHIQFDVAIEASAATTRMMLDIDLTHNGISNTNSSSWAVVSK